MPDLQLARTQKARTQNMILEGDFPSTYCVIALVFRTSNAKSEGEICKGESTPLFPRKPSTDQALDQPEVSLFKDSPPQHKLKGGIVDDVSSSMDCHGMIKGGSSNDVTSM